MMFDIFWNTPQKVFSKHSIDDEVLGSDVSNTLSCHLNGPTSIKNKFSIGDLHNANN
jgi:hypothetical protein